MLATSLARDLYRDWYGEEPPPVLPWRIDAIPHTGDPTLPLYTVDRDAWRVTLNLHEGQMRAWESDSLYTFMLAGAQGGKTAFLPWVLARKILADMAAGSDGGDYLIATSTSQLFNSGFRPVILEVFEYVLGIARMWPSTDFFELRDPATGSSGRMAQRIACGAVSCYALRRRVARWKVLRRRPRYWTSAARTRSRCTHGKQ